MAGVDGQEAVEVDAEFGDVSDDVADGGAEFFFGVTGDFAGGDAAVHGEDGLGGDGVDLGAFADAEDSADAEGGVHLFAVGGLEESTGEFVLERLEPHREGGHFLEGVDAVFRG